jgi:hypothetical protein
LKKLIILPLFLIYWGCEEEIVVESFSLVDEWVECARMYSITEYENDSTVTNEWNWDGLRRDIYHTDGSLNYYKLYNNYGYDIYKEYADGRKIIFERFDGWKKLSDIHINEYGDTTNIINWIWDELTMYNINESGHKGEVTFNSYGRAILLTNVDTSTGEEFGRQELEFLDDNRRMLSYKLIQFNELEYEEIIEWTGSSFIRKKYNHDGILTAKYLGEINEYGVTIESEYYECNGEGNCDYLYKTNIYYDCDYFDPIPN